MGLTHPKIHFRRPLPRLQELDAKLSDVETVAARIAFLAGQAFGHCPVVVFPPLVPCFSHSMRFWTLMVVGVDHFGGMQKKDGTSLANPVRK